MKKLSSMLLMCVSLIALGVTFISCSKDDDDENSHPNNNTKKYLAEISVETEIVNYIRNNYGYIRSYEYKGNIVTVTTTLLEDGSFFYKTFMNMTITII